MEISLPLGFSQNIRNLLRKAGYSEFVDPNSGQISYSRRLSRDFYPRFHLYVNEKEGQIFLNLHLDQKRPTYPGSHAHNAEYDGEVVEKEKEKIQNIIYSYLKLPTDKKIKESKGFLARIFKF